MNLLAIDYGTKNIGLAINNGTDIAFPFRVIASGEREIEEIKDICDEDNIDAIIIGRPTKMKPPKNFHPLSRGREEGVLAGEIKEFAAKLKEATGKPVEFEDEILSSAAAKKLMAEYGGKYDKDAVEAAVILQTFLDKNV